MKFAGRLRALLLGVAVVLAATASVTFIPIGQQIAAAGNGGGGSGIASTALPSADIEP